MKPSYYEIPDNLFTACPGCKRMVYTKQLTANLMVCNHCGHHFYLPATTRINVTLDEGSFEELYAGLSSNDPLEFPQYQDKIARDRKATGLSDAFVAGTGKIHGYCVNIGVLDFSFMGGSMGSVVGEKVARLMQKTAEEEGSLVIFAASGGARMQEGLISLMQMAKTCGARADLLDAGRPYYCVLTNPTTAGVWASFASVADVILAEPGAMVAFAGNRVSQQTKVSEQEPANYKTAEFQLEKGMVDLIVERSKHREILAQLLQFSRTGGETR